MDVDHDNLTVRVDWHGYAVDQVEVWADRVVEAAYLNGFERVEFVHGAGDVLTRGTLGFGGDPRDRAHHSGPAGRGSIKDFLRRRLYSTRWKSWVAERREGRHHVEEGSMSIALKNNPEHSTAPWPLLPPPAHG